jgi:endopolyphosphatase
MNIDHFFVHDSKDINLDVMNGDTTGVLDVREAMEDEISVESTADYLQELRDGWSKLPKPDVGAFDAEAEDLDLARQQQKKRRKKKHGKNPSKELGGRWAERYQLSLISPSIVPNYFPTLRVVEYNISGLEQATLWTDAFGANSASMRVEHGNVLHEELKREIEEGANKNKGKKDRKKNKPTKPTEPNFVIPNPPAKTSPPGPAYSPQPLTLLGYTQYFANLTYINNDMTKDDFSPDKWRDGIHKDKDPKSKKPKPKPFEFQAEYSTFDDKIYKLDDLTVRSFVKLAYRIAQQKPKGEAYEEDFEPEVGTEHDDSEPDDSDSDHDIDAHGGSSNKGGKHDKNKKKKRNKVWLHFLSHAFVKTVPKKELKKLDS